MSICIFYEKRFFRLASRLSQILNEKGFKSSIYESSNLFNEIFLDFSFDYILVIDEDEFQPVLSKAMKLHKQLKTRGLLIYDISDTDEMFIEKHLNTLRNSKDIRVLRSQHSIGKNYSCEHWFVMSPYLTYSTLDCTDQYRNCSKKRKVLFRGSVFNTDENEYLNLRKEALDILFESLGEDLTSCYPDSFLSQDAYLDELSMFSLCFCPPGSADLTWRMVESCFVGTIPVFTEFDRRQATYYDDIFDKTNSFTLPTDCDALHNALKSRATMLRMANRCRSLYTNHNNPVVIANHIISNLPGEIYDN